MMRPDGRRSYRSPFGSLDEGGGGWRPAEQVLTGFQLPIGGVVGQGFGKPEGGLPFGVNG